MENEIISTKNLTLTPINGEVTISLLEIDRLRQEAAESAETNYRNQAIEANDKYGKLIGDHEKLKKDYERHCEISQNHTKMHNELADKYFLLRSEFDNLQKVTTIRRII